jgi:hypothetical protein
MQVIHRFAGAIAGGDAAAALTAGEAINNVWHGGTVIPNRLGCSLCSDSSDVVMAWKETRAWRASCVAAGAD